MSDKKEISKKKTQEKNLIINKDLEDELLVTKKELTKTTDVGGEENEGKKDVEGLDVKKEVSETSNPVSDLKVDAKVSPKSTIDVVREKRENKDNSILEEKKEIRLEQIFDILGSLRSIISSSTNISIEEKEYGVNGYGPCSWMPSISSSIESRYEVMSIGLNKCPFIIRKPISFSKITDIDSYINVVYDNVQDLLIKTSVFIHEPPTMRMLEDLYVDPELLGFPYGKLMTTNSDVNLIQNAVARFLNPTRRVDNFNYSDGYVFTGMSNQKVLTTFFDISQREMRSLANTIDLEELRTRDGIPDSVRRPLLQNNALYEVVANPFVITSMFNGLPRPMHFSSGLILELQKPDVLLGPIDTGVLQKNASLSMTRTVSINALFAIDYTPDMNDAINAYFMSIIVPGLIHFDIDMSDINAEDLPMRAFCALGSKLLFSFSDSSRWNNLNMRSARSVERAILLSGVSSRILQPLADMGPLPLNNAIPNPDSKLKNYALLITGNDGSGWREGPFQRYSENPMRMPYVQCARRQKYVHDYDDKRIVDFEDLQIESTNWGVGKAGRSFLSAMEQFGGGKAMYNGTTSIFRVLAQRIFEFFAVINDYNRKNWYSALRLSDRMIDELYTGSSKEPVIVTIKGKTILYLMKALSKDTVIERKVPYLAQIKAECAIARDCLESATREHVYERINRKIDIPVNSFKKGYHLLHQQKDH